MLGPALLVLGPLAAIAPLLLLRRARASMNAWMALTTLATFGGVLALAPTVTREGEAVTELHTRLGELVFTLDGVGLVVALASTFVWLTSTLYAGAYLGTDRSQLRYHVVSLGALSAMLGVVTAGNLVTLYVFFEWLGLICYLLVVHEGGRAAERAGTKYLVLVLLGGIALLTGVMLVHSLGGGPLDTPLAVAPGREGARVAAGVLLLLGFGVKAGVLGLHIWLPDAHTAAPAPASALLSGVIIKAGAFGVVRTLSVLYAGVPGVAAAGARQGEALGLLVLWAGVATMLGGALMALWQYEAKRLLAYSSVSQIGFVLVGVGAARVLGADGGAGWTGSLAHITHHALFKALLFLGLGAVIHATGTGDLRRLGAVARRMPWTFGLVLIAAAGIVGVPGFSGFISKTVLHHALAQAAEHHAGLGLLWAERVFVLATIGTAAALTKLVAMTFLGPARDATVRPGADASWRMRGAMGLLASSVLLLGIRPDTLAPAITTGIEHLAPAANVASLLSAPLTAASDLATASVTVVLGVLVHVVARRTRAYDRPVPPWLSLDRTAVAAVTWSMSAARQLEHRHADWRSTWVRRSWRRLLKLAIATSRHADSWRRRVLAAFASLAGRLDRSDQLRDRTDAGAHGTSRTRRAPSRATEPHGGGDPERLVRATRREIQRHSRDIGRAVAAVFLVWLALLASLLAGRG